MNRFLTGVAGIGFPILLLLILLTIPHDACAITVGDAAPGFSLYDLDGSTHSLSSEAGRIVLLYFLGYNATVCVDAAGGIDRDLYGQYSSRGVDFFGIDCWDGTTDEVEQFRGMSGVRYPILQAGLGVASDYSVSYNSIVIVDAHGVVRYVADGPDPSAYSSSAISSVLDQLMGEANRTQEATWGVIKTLYNRKKM